MTQSVLLILSAQYCNPELQAEFGAKLPACAVPIGPNTLANVQIETAYANDPDLKAVFIALPHDSYDLTVGMLERWGDKCIFVETVKSTSIEETFQLLMKSFIDWETSSYPLGRIRRNEWRVHLLNGDTLIRNANAWNTVGTVHSSTTSPFEWSKEYMKEQTSHIVYAGMATFVWDGHMPADEIDYRTVVTNGEVIDVPPQEWFDFGHSATYYRSKRNMLSTRAANRITLTPSRNQIEKSGISDKIKDEIRWYRNLPEQVAIYTPRIYHNMRRPTYIMEYCPAPSLAELMVHGNHGYAFWDNVMEKLRDLLLTMRVAADGCEEKLTVTAGLQLEKTEQRTREFKSRYRKNVETLIHYLLDTYKEPKPSVVHGDLCFSNVLYDARSDSLKMLDPRGPNIYGDQLYDVAKLYHSTMGQYDFVMAKRKPRENQTKTLRYLSDHIVAYAEQQCGASKKQLTAATALLFYSMIPLHTEDEDRVVQLMNKAEMLHEIWKDEK